MTQQRITPTEQRQATLAATHATAARERRRRRLAVGAVVATAALILAGVAALAFVGGSTTTTARSGYSASRDSFRLPGLLDERATVRLSDHRGTPVVVNFFASWCVYCNEELPGFVQVAKATTGTVDFIGVDTGDPGDGAAMARRFHLAGAGFDLASDIGSNPPSDLWQSFNAQGLPVTAFYDSTGTLVDFSGGMLTQSDLEQRIQANFGIDATAPDAANLRAPVIPLIPQGAYELLSHAQGDAALTPVDLRPAPEFAAGHVPGAVNIAYPFGDVAAATSRLDKAASYVLYDSDGSTTTMAADALHEAGFKHVYVIEGGIASWTGQGLPTSTR